MKSKVDPKKIQTETGSSYRFGDFELNPTERLLSRRGHSVAISPKAFDALLFLVRRADHLTGKDTLMNALWPDTHVGEANLTNCIVSLRKILGPESIQTVSRHGYRFTLTVQGEPGIAIDTYERFVKAKDLVRVRSIESLTAARDLLWVCLAENPLFAPAWAWLGRCCWLSGKVTSTSPDLAMAAIRRALSIAPDLACAHQFLTPIEIDTGQARHSLVRLRERAARFPGEPETQVSLVQVFRYCGLLRESIEADRLAMDLDPSVSTSVAHTLFLMGDFPGALESYGGRAGYYMDAAAWAALGESGRAAQLLRKRLEQPGMGGLLAVLMRSLLAILEERMQDALSLMDGAGIRHEPEALLYLARHYGRIGAADSAVEMIRRAAREGFVCPPETLAGDPWLASVRSHEFHSSLMAESRKSVRSARG